MKTRRLTTLLAAVGSLTLAASAQAAPVWTPPNNLATMTDPNSQPLIDVASSGDSVVLVRDAFSGGKYGFRVTLRSPGQPFIKRILPSGGSTQVPQFAEAAVDLAASGRGIVAWQQSNGLFYSLRSPGGLFGTPQQVTGLPTAGLSSIKVATDNAGNATFLWTTVAGTFPTYTSHVYATERRADGVFVNSQTLASLAGSDATWDLQVLHVNGAGAAVAAWRLFSEGSGDVHFGFRGGALTPIAGILTSSTALAGDAAIDATGDSAFAVTTISGLQVRYRKAGGSLTAPSDLGQSSSDPNLAIADNGTATALWETSNGSNAVLKACSFTTAGCLKPAATVVTAPTSLGGSLAVNSSGAAVVVWTADLFGTPTVRARPRTAAGAWGTTATVGVANSKYGMVGIDDAGNAIATWRFEHAGTSQTRVSMLDVTAPS